MIERYKSFSNVKKMSFKWDNNKLLRKYEEIFNNITKKIDKELDGEHT